MKYIEASKREPEDEASLLEQYRLHGNVAAIGKVYENYMALVYGLCLKMLQDEEKAKDAVMQIFEELVVKLKKHEVSNFRSWLYTFSRNHCLMILRARSKQDFVPIDENFMEKDAFQHLNTEDSHEDRLRLMEKCVEQLPIEQRQAIRLFYLEQKCYKEVSELTGYDSGKVKSYIQNGKRNLKICMEKNSEK